jgi:vacuolar-type H+-ATPase subunit C/Vma6
MGLRLFTFPYGSVRARALAAGLLREAQFLELVHSSSRAQAERMLERLPGFSGTADESALPASYLAFGRKIARALPPRAGRLVSAYLGRTQIENLKLLCRAILTGRREHAESSLLPEVPEKSKSITTQQLAARSLEELAAILPPGDFRNLLSKPMPSALEERLFFLDSALEKIFWFGLDGQLTELALFDRLAAREILGLRADIDRFRVIGRGLHAGLPAATILAALPPLGTLLPPRQVRQALAAADPAAACRQLLATVTRDPFDEQEGELFLFRRLYRHLQKTLRCAPFDISVPLSALLLKELEIRDLLSIMSGQRLNADRKELTSMLCCLGS